MTEVTAHKGLFKNTKLYVEDTGGSGRAVVLIHGWPLDADSWADQVPALSAAGYRVVSYDRRGFGRSDKPRSGYDYDTLTDDLHTLLHELEIENATLVGFSMGGGEVARYFPKYGTEHLHSVVFASAVPPYLMQSDDNPDGPLTKQQADEFTQGLTNDENGFYDEFITNFFTAGDAVVVSDAQRAEARAMCDLADKDAALATMGSWGTTDFRNDLTQVSVPTLVLHGDDDAVVPFEGSGKRTHEAVAGSELHVIAGAPHGCNVSHTDEFNRTLLDFLAR